MRRRWAGLVPTLAAALCVVGSGAGEARAQTRAPDRDYGSMYEDRLLQEKQSGYRDVVLWNLNSVFLPKLTPEERRRLQGLDVQFPLRGPERQLFEYFATAPARVVLPVMAIRFLADLSVAYAWLQSQNYTLETVTDYVSMLKYQPSSRFGGRYPDPRAALQIPSNATDDPRVDLISGKILNESLSFVLLHEVGHILFRHPGYGPGVPRERARENEDQADRFALEVLRRVGQPVDGLLFWFLSAAHFVAHRADFGSDAEYQAYLRTDTHPLTTERARRLSEYLRMHAADYGRLQANPARAAEVIRGTADAIELEVLPVLADPDQQRLMAMKGQRVSLETLAPRRPGETMAAPEPSAPFPGRPGPAVDGVFDGQLSDNTGALPARTALRRQGDRVTGVYSYGAGQGEISGIARGDTLIFVWQSGGQRGRGRVRTTPGGVEFNGTWGYGDAFAGGGTWTGARRGR
jgi:hypothetical protein